MAGRAPQRDNTYQQGFLNGLRFMLANFSHLFLNDPVAMTKALVMVRHAELGHRAPTLIEVPWSSSRKDWRKEFENVRVRFDPRGQARHLAELRPVAPPRPPGRPSHTSTEWTEEPAHVD